LEKDQQQQKGRIKYRSAILYRIRMEGVPKEESAEVASLKNEKHTHWKKVGEWWRRGTEGEVRI